MSREFFDEKKFLLISTVGSLLIGSLGVTLSFFASSQAILLDGLFNLVYFVACLLTIKVAQLIKRGDTEAFPFGYAYFEPLINGAKGALVLGVTIIAFIGSVETLLSGGSEIAAGIAILYGGLATAACWFLAMVTYKGSKRTRSPLVQADAANWLINAAISSAVLIAFIIVFLAQGTAFEAFSPYIDPLLVIVIVMISVSVPIKMAWNSVLELLDRSPPAEIIGQLRKTLEDELVDLPVQMLHLRVTQAGRTRMLLVHVVLPSHYPVESLSKLDGFQSSCLLALKKEHPNTFLDMVFTADPEMGAAVNKGS